MPQSLYYSDGYYVFLFANLANEEDILNARPYTYHYMPFILKNWEIDFVFHNEYMITILLQVYLPGLLVGYWSMEALSKPTSENSTLLYTDRFIVDRNRISYTSVLVEVDLYPSPIG
uniref:Uncharacterized protein n=1 Tax=Solanum lycopersicum TaxID=4081 RepID=A0A3Q7FGN5_SOLLC